MNVEDYLRMCYRAARNSPDPSNQNGAVLVDLGTGKVVGKSCNHFSRKIKPHLADRDQKIARITHAEEGCVMSAWGQKGPLVMYCPWASCADCARDIINCPAEIVTLVVHEERMALTPARWVKSIEYAHTMLKEAGIEISVHKGRIPDGKTIICNGQNWSPNLLKVVG